MAAVVESHVRSSDAELHSDEDLEESEGGSDLEDSEGSIADSHDGDGDAGSDEDEGEAEAEDSELDEGTSANAGWADAMAKVLGKTTANNQSTILQKNKDLLKVKEKQREEQLEHRKQLDKKRSWEMLCRVKPDIVKDKEPEKALQRIATRGVVQLFNAVKKHQKTIDEKVKEVGGSERKKAKILSSVSKKDFIDVLRRNEETAAGKTAKKERTAAACVKQEQEAPAWSVLREDFMMGASMKDWDKESDEDEPGDTSVALQEGSESD